MMTYTSETPNTRRMVIGVDTAKTVFHLHWVDPATGLVMERTTGRNTFLEHFANLQPAVVTLEACGGSHRWGRQLQALGHTVLLLPAARVKAFCSGNKNDRRDALGIWTAAQQGSIRPVAVKSEEQQSILALHSMREQVKKFRTAQINALRGLLTEFGEVLPQGRSGLQRGLPAALDRLSARLAAAVIHALEAQWARILQMDHEIDEIERQLKQWLKSNEAARRLSAIPGVGPITATAMVAAMGNPSDFRSAREFAAWLGLAPRHSGTGGRVRILGISKRGDKYLRTLLIHGARSVMAGAKAPSPWAASLKARRPMNVAVVAQANKMARTIWALLAHDREWQPDFVRTNQPDFTCQPA